MRIALLSTFHPYRGGIAQFNASLMHELGLSHVVKAFNFSLQYPEFLFPGKTQYVREDDPAPALESERCLSTINPLSWASTAKKIRAFAPDLLVVRYWMSWFAPSLGWVLRHCECKKLAILDNVVPHEPRFFDKPLTKYFLGGCNGFVTMADSVSADLLRLKPDAKYICHPHPLYSHFGEKMSRTEAEDLLGLEHGKKNLLFFGLIRDYKGLDILLEAFRTLPGDYQLIIAGEPYGSFDRYQALIDEIGTDRIRCFPDYIPDNGVSRFFSAADVCVLPYRSATQSGISAIAYHFDVPMIVTAVGGLKGTIGDRGTGLVAKEPAPDAVRKEILRYFSDESIASACREAIGREKERLSWSRFAGETVNFAKTL